MKREKRLTKRERRGGEPARPALPAAANSESSAPHIHCIACGRHIDAHEFDGISPSAMYLTCDHKSRFPSCSECQVTARYLISEHDRTGNAIAAAQAWH
jgi:hypothetical protein